MIKFNKSLFMLIVLCSCISVSSWANRKEYVLEIKDHLFHPSTIEIPQNQKVKLVIYNRDSTPEEFDSFDLNREKVIFPNKKAVIFIGPLPVGRYEFFGEYNPNSAKGAVIVTDEKNIKNTSVPLSASVNLIENNPILINLAKNKLIVEGAKHAD